MSRIFISSLLRTSKTHLSKLKSNPNQNVNIFHSPKYNFIKPCKIPSLLNPKLPSLRGLTILNWNKFSTTVENLADENNREKACSSSFEHGRYVEESTNNAVSRKKVDEEALRNGDYSKAKTRDPVELYAEVTERIKEKKSVNADWDLVNDVFIGFALSSWARNQSLALYIKKDLFKTAAVKFQKFFMEGCPKDVAEYLVMLGWFRRHEEADKYLFPVFVEFCLEEYVDEIKEYQTMVANADMTKPHTWFPYARAMKRKIVYHCGPTNSGKTYNALQRFMEAKSGIYCSPLRLLAMEVFEKVNAAGVYCSLITGQEKNRVPFSSHIACTVEMASSEQLYDVAIIDEIQMMTDPHRGYAWTLALLGLKADEIHLCGDPSVLEIVRDICKDTGDELVENHYKRFKPLVVEAKTLLGDLKNIRAGDCVVAFSRREIFEAKLAIEKCTNHKCCVIYGALPPETRRHQANLFNDQNNDFDVLVASDAVGMGLNLNIGRVIFYSLSKYNGDKIVPVNSSQVKQIAGRAGRRGSCYPDGLATTLNLSDLDYLIECLKEPFEHASKVGLFPCYEQIELFAGQIPNISFVQLLNKFAENCRLDHSYFMCRHDNIKKVAQLLERVEGLSLEDRFNFCFAPVNIRDPKAMFHLRKFADIYSRKLPVNISMGMPRGSARCDTDLLDLETKHQILSMYLWLSNHFKQEEFPFAVKAAAMAADIAVLLGQSLTKINWQAESRQQPGKLKAEQKEGVQRNPTSPVNENRKLPDSGQTEHAYKRPLNLIKDFHHKKSGNIPQDMSSNVA